MNRRGFLSSMLALGVAPAVVSSGVLMPVKKLLLPDGELEIGTWDNIRFIETADISPVNFILMQELLKAAKKRLPYFNDALPARLQKPSRLTVSWRAIPSPR